MHARNLFDCKMLCSYVGFGNHVVRLECDSDNEIFLAKNTTYHSNTKQIDVQYHFMREMVESQNVLLEKVNMMKNVADSLMKSISVKEFS